MTDIRLNVTGDSSGGVAAMNDMSGSVGKSVVVWTEMANAAKAAGKAVIDFLVDSTKKYADSERVLRQLERASGEYSGALEEQAKALSKLYAVDDDLIMQSETLLSQWGGAAAASKEAETAALNLAAAMGTDLNSATETLIRNVESGGTGLAKMGIHFKTTGDKGKDLAAAVAAINGKLGGAAGADAASLVGQLHAADLAFEDIQKTLGGSIAAFLEQSGAAGMLTNALRNLNEFIGNEGANKLLKDGERMTDWVNAQRDLAEAQLALREASADPMVGLNILEAFSDDVDRAQKKVDALKASAAPLLGNAPGVTGTTNKGMKDGSNSKSQADLNEESLKATKAYYDGIETLALTAEQQETQNFADELAREAKSVSDTIDVRKAGQKAYDEIRVSEEKKTAEHAEKLADIDRKKQEESTKDTMERSKKRADEAASTGAAIGTAFVNALSEQLQKLAAGEEFDVALFVGDILASVIAVAGTVIGTAYGQPALGAAVGNLAAMGVRAGAGAISANTKKERKGAKKYHSGGWIGADEEVLIGQQGERMLSGNEVQRMGGRAAVDTAATGGARGMGAGLQVTVHAMDAKNAAEGFMGALGQGLKKALRTGHGDVPRLLGAIPR